MKYKKIINTLLIIAILMGVIILPQDKIEAKTLGDLKRELANTEAKAKENQQQKQLTEQQINNVNSSIKGIMNEIDASQKTVANLNDQIAQLAEDIKKKEQQIKDIVSFYQLSDGDSTYLEYAFGAKDFTDFIYRVAVTEQLLSHNEQAIKDFNKMIKDSKQKQVDLKNKAIELEKKQGQLEKKLETLDTKLEDISDLKADIDKELKAQRAAVEMYEKKYKCKDNEDISTCTRGRLPADTKFYRPLVSGYLSSNYGYRTYTIGGRVTSDFHSGMDLSTPDTGSVPVYASAAGVVAGIVRYASCGGNKIYIHHKINGVNYTTSYVHLRSILVSVGQVVTKDTKIAIMGGNPSRETWDHCSTGAHLHFAMNYGHYLTEYTSWNQYLAKTFNPRSMVNVPATGYFTDRYTKY